MRGRSRGRLAAGLGTGAVLWSLALVAAAFLLPAYRGEACEGVPSATPVCSSSSQTLFAANGWWVVELLLLVALVTSLAFWALHVRCATGSGLAQRLAVLCIFALTVFSFLTGFSIGPIVFPVVLLLIASAALTPTPGAPRRR